MNEKHEKPVKIWFDGGARPNPGAMETAVVVRGVAEIRRGLGHGSNEEAEWLALLHALETATAQGLRDIILIGDSLSVIWQAEGLQKARSDAARSCHARYLHLAAGFGRVRLRHCGRSRNIAGTALERARWTATD